MRGPPWFGVHFQTLPGVGQGTQRFHQNPKGEYPFGAIPLKGHPKSNETPQTLEYMALNRLNKVDLHIRSLIWAWSGEILDFLQVVPGCRKTVGRGFPGVKAVFFIATGDRKHRRSREEHPPRSHLAHAHLGVGYPLIKHFHPI